VGGVAEGEPAPAPPPATATVAAPAKSARVRDHGGRSAGARRRARARPCRAAHRPRRRARNRHRRAGWSRSSRISIARRSTRRRTIAQVALLKHRDFGDDVKPYLALLRTPERTNVAQSGLLGDGMPNHKTVYEALPGPRELAPGADQVELRLQATAPNGDRIVQVLTFHRGSYVIDVAYDVTNAGAAPIAPYAYYQLTRDTKAQGQQNPIGAGIVRRAGHLQRDRQVQEGGIRRSRQARRRSEPQAPVHEEHRQRLGRHGRALTSCRRGCRGTRRRRRAKFYARRLEAGLYAAGVIVAGRTIAPAGDRRGADTALRRGRRSKTSSPGSRRASIWSFDLRIFTVIAAPLFWLLNVAGTAWSTTGGGRSCCSPSSSRARSIR